MKQSYMVSLCQNGLIGGVLYVEPDGLIYSTNKLTVPAAYRRIKMPAADIAGWDTGSVLMLPTVTIRLSGGRSYEFIVYSRSKFLDALGSVTAAG